MRGHPSHDPAGQPGSKQAAAGGRDDQGRKDKYAQGGRAGGRPGHGRAQARRFLRAAIALSDSAVKTTYDAGQEPKTTKSGDRPGTKKYYNRLFSWASRYAWDKHDGLDARETAPNLVITVYVGYSNPAERKSAAAS